MGEDQGIAVRPVWSQTTGHAELDRADSGRHGRRASVARWPLSAAPLLAVALLMALAVTVLLFVAEDILVVPFVWTWTWLMRLIGGNP
jgi:hypothetical protein